MELSHTAKNQIRVSFEQIVQKCKTVGDLQKLDQEVKKLKRQNGQPQKR
mgnify:CR=1 FL=1